MSKRGSGPALYEVIQGRGPTRVAAPEPPRAPAPPPVPGVSGGESWAWLSPGRVLRVPAGYVLVAAAAVIVLLLLSHMIGYRRGEQAATAVAMALEAQRLQIMDPERAGPAATAALETPGASKPGAADPGSRERARSPGATQGEPRQPGLNYFVLMQTTPAGARRFTDFCRAEGLDARTVAADNRNSLKVIVLPGYAAGGQRESPQIKALEQRITAAFAKWRTQTREKVDLAYYPEKYEGR